MMFIDASAIVAMLSDEPEGRRLSRALARDDEPISSAVAVYEITARLISKSSLSGEEARQAVNEFLRAANIRLVNIAQPEAQATLIAFEQYGKGDIARI